MQSFITSKIVKKIVDSGIVKTCDEIVTRQQNSLLQLFDICNMLMEIWMRAHLTSNDKKMVYYIKLIVNFLIMSSDFGEINLHLHSIQSGIPTCTTYEMALRSFFKVLQKNTFSHQKYARVPKFKKIIPVACHWCRWRSIYPSVCSRSSHIGPDDILPFVPAYLIETEEYVDNKKF